MSDNITEVTFAGVGIINVQGFTCTVTDGSKPKMNGITNYRMNKGPKTAELKILVTKDEYAIYIANSVGRTIAISARNSAWESRTGRTGYFEGATCYIKGDAENKNETTEEATDENVEVTCIPLGEFTNLDVIHNPGQTGEAVA